MENINKAIVRGEGATTVVFDLTAFTPAINLLTTDEVVLRIEDKNAPRILKRNSNVDNGSDDEIEINATNDTVTVNLSPEERNTLIPNSGYTHKLFINDTPVAYGNITNSGTAPEEYDPPVEPSGGVTRIRSVYEGQTLKAVQDEITDAAAGNTYLINFFPGALIGSGFVANQYIRVHFIGNSARGLDWEEADLTNGEHMLSGLDVTGCDFTNVTMPASVSTESINAAVISFKDIVGNFDDDTTIWINGQSLGQSET